MVDSLSPHKPRPSLPAVLCAAELGSTVDLQLRPARHEAKAMRTMKSGKKRGCSLATGGGVNSTAIASAALTFDATEPLRFIWSWSQASA